MLLISNEVQKTDVIIGRSASEQLCLKVTKKERKLIEKKQTKMWEYEIKNADVHVEYG